MDWIELNDVWTTRFSHAWIMKIDVRKMAKDTHTHWKCLHIYARKYDDLKQNQMTKDQKIKIDRTGGDSIPNEWMIDCLNMNLILMGRWWMMVYDGLPMLQSSLNSVCVLVLYRMLIVLFILSSGKRLTATPTSASSSQTFFKRTFGFMCSGTTNFVWSVFRLKFSKENTGVYVVVTIAITNEIIISSLYLFDADVRSWLFVCFSNFGFELLLSLGKTTEKLKIKFSYSLNACTEFKAYQAYHSCSD